MALDASVSILVKICGYAVAPIGHRFGYLTHDKRNVETLRMQIQNLGDKRDGVQRALDAATRNGEEIKADVRRWLTDVENIMAEAEKLDGDIDANQRYLKWWHPNLRLRYKLSKEARRLSYIVMGLQGGGLVENAPPPGTEAMPGFLPTSVDSMSISLPAPPPGIEFMSTPDFVAFASTKSVLYQIFEALKDENCNIVGVYGMGGVGKTTLVKELGKKVEEQKLFDRVVMAVVSQNAVMKNIQGQIADMLGLTFREETESGRAGRLFARLKTEKRVLIILDDVWARLDLKAVGIPHGVDHEGCKIILTTRRETVCTVMGIKTKKIPVNVLSNKESWDLFQRHVGVDIESTPLNVPARAIVQECKGLPIALVTVGRAMRDKDLEEWNAAVQQLKNSKGTNIEGLDQDVFSCIRLSYDYLPGEETKLCFLFCCLFPEDYVIEIECLARYAMGKGFITNVDTMVEARSRVRSIIKNLKASGMLLDCYEGYVKMHDIVRDVAISIASERNHDLFLVRAGAGLKEWPRMETFESYTGISLMRNEFQELPKGLEFPRLQILLLGKNDGVEAIPEAFFEGMGMLKVLDLMDTTPKRILSLPPSLKLLTNLRTLHLDRCKLGNISVLFILKKLEILSFRGSDITTLPEEIGELINLRVLDLTVCEDLERIPPNVLSQLARLEELYMGRSFQSWEVEGTSGERSSASLSELKLLPCLTILCVQVNKVACLLDNFPLPNLIKFGIAVGLPSPDFYPNSTSLYLSGIRAPLSKSLVQMVEELTILQMSGRCDNILPGIDEAGLNGLKSLEVFSCYEIESLINTNQWKPVIIFANLEYLSLLNLDYMEVMCRGLIPNGSLEKLRVLKIKKCRILRATVPASLVHRLFFLEEMSVEECEKVQVIFQLNEVVDEQEPTNLVLPRLRKFDLTNLPQLHSIWYGSRSLVSLRNLTEVEIIRCPKVSFIFSLSLAQSLLHLESLTIKYCDNLETIVAEDQGTVLNNCIQPIKFPNLKFIKVECCHRLTSIFTIATARCLVKLKEVLLFGNSQLLEIVCHGMKREEEGDEKEILLPQLHLLELKYMRRLERLCPGSFHMHLPSLKELFVKDCPMLKNFPADATAYGLKSATNLVYIQVEEHTSYDIFGKQLKGRLYRAMQSGENHKTAHPDDD